MRARNLNPPRATSRCLLALLTALAVSGSWAQEAPEPEAPVAPVPAVPAAPAAPSAEQEMERLQREMELKSRELERHAREMERHARQVERQVERQMEKQVRIYRGEDGSLRIKTRDENGERAEVQVDLGEDFGGALTRRIYDELESKGILDEKGLVVEEAMDAVPKNINIGISGDLGRAQRHDHHEKDSGDDGMEWLIPIIGILAVFGTPVLIVWLVTRNSYRKKQLLMDNINRMVAEGRDIPQEMLDALEGSSPANLKDRGFTLIAVGLAVFIWLSISAGPEVGSLGLIPLFIGVARFINWKLEQQQNSNQAG